MIIGIVTWYKYGNFGSVLQVYALQQAIKKLGYDNNIIQYHGNQYISKKRTNLTELNQRVIRKIKKIFGICEYKYSSYFETEYQNRNIKFNDFRNNYLVFSKEFGSYKELERNDEYDAYICGSDQIWSPALIDKFYYLDFVENKNKTIAYAPSFGRSYISKDVSEVVISLINNISFLSIRENKGAELIRELTGREAIVVLDPTFLLSADEWDKILIKPKEIKQYILCYFLGELSACKYHKIKELQKKGDYKLIIIANKISDLKYKQFCEINVGPREFIGYVKNASIICTDSFHGIAFSIIFKKQFYAFLRFKDNEVNSQNSRVYNILETFSLNSRLVFPEKEITDSDIYYKNIQEILNNQVLKSIDYLSSSLKNIKENIL